MTLTPNHNPPDVLPSMIQHLCAVCRRAGARDSHRGAKPIRWVDCRQSHSCYCTTAFFRPQAAGGSAAVQPGSRRGASAVFTGATGRRGLAARLHFPHLPHACILVLPHGNCRRRHDKAFGLAVFIDDAWEGDRATVASTAHGQSSLASCLVLLLSIFVHVTFLSCKYV